MENDTLDNMPNETITPHRSQFLTVLCVLSFICIGFTILSNIYSAVKNTPENMQKSIEQVRAVSPEMADQMENNMIAMQNNTYMKISPYLSIVFVLISLMSVIMMWNLNKNGFYIYSIAELLPYIGFFFMDSKSITIPGLPANYGSILMMVGFVLMLLFDILFVVLYQRNLKYMK